MASSATIQEQEEQLCLQSYYPENLQHNAKQIDYVRSTCLSVAGSVAGVLGLTNLSGFYFYLFSLALVNTFVLVINAHANPSRYLISTTTLPKLTDSTKLSTSSSTLTKFTSTDTAKVLLQGLSDNGFSYVLWWTFWYGIVHVYD